MKTSNIIAAAALSLFAVAGAHAEQYEGVHPLTHGASRADVSAQAVAAARAGNVYGDGQSFNVAPVLTASVDRSVVRAEAVAAAHAPNQNLDRKAFVNSVVPTQYTDGSLKIRATRQAAL